LANYSIHVLVKIIFEVFLDQTQSVLNSKNIMHK